MRTDKPFYINMALTTLLVVGFAASGIAQDTGPINSSETKAPSILAITPADGEMNVDPGSVIKITFSSDMDEKSLNGTTLLLHATNADTMSMYEVHDEVMLEEQMKDRSEIKDSEHSRRYTAGVVSGTVSYADKVAIFTPDTELKEGARYTFTVTNGVKSSENIALERDQSWSFTIMGKSESTYSDKYNSENGMGGTGHEPMHSSSTNKMKSIDLGKAGHFVILAKKDVNNESGSKITGHIGEGSEANAMKSENASGQSNDDRESEQNDMTTSSPDVTEAIEVLESTYSDVLKHKADELTTHNTNSFHHDPALKPGVHEWKSSIQITDDVTLSGSADDVWVFKTDKNLTVDENVVITLTDGARADNVFWYVEGEVSIGKNAQFEGIILSMNEITLEKGAKLKGRMFSQTSITLDDNTITEPRSMAGQTSSKNK